MTLLNKQQLKTFTNERSNIQRVFQSVLCSLLLLQTTLLFFSAGFISEMKFLKCRLLVGLVTYFPI